MENLDKKLQEKEEKLKAQNELLIYKEELLALQNQKLLSKEQELAEYINKLFEHQEKERIIKEIVNSIRESLDLDHVLSKTVSKIGYLLKADRCLIALYDHKLLKFHLKNEYIAFNDINSLFLTEKEFHINEEGYKELIVNKSIISINDANACTVNSIKDNFLNYPDIKSLIVVPIIDANGILGILIIHQVQYKRKWSSSHIKLLEDIISQITISLRQAILYKQVQETTKLKSEFLTSMSHEFRTPLNAIIGFSEMILTRKYGELTQKQNDYIGNISTSGKHLLRLVNDLLDLSKVESGNMTLNFEKFKVRELINETVSILENMAIKKFINININIPNIMINADSLRFRQIMYNLLSNAIKFTEEHGEININANILDSKLKIEIQDTGVGISLENRDKIFSEFRQIDSSYTRKQEGTGLGLTLTKKLIEIHDGYIDFKSEENKGSKFWFVLPGVEQNI